MDMSDKYWTTSRLKIAFDRYLAENDHLPTAPEIDATDYMPSARQIQRKFGGVKALRKLLGYSETDFSSGASRSRIALSINMRAKEAERELERQLSQIFGEPFVHTEKYFGKERNRGDFIVYTKDEIFGIDVFTTETIHDLQKNVAVKVNKYLGFPKNVTLFFVVVSRNLKEHDVVLACKGMQKAKKLPQLKIVTVKGIFDQVERLTPYSVPKDFISIYGKDQP